MPGWDELSATQHLEDLAEEHDIEITWTAGTDWQESLSFVSARAVYIPVPTDFGAYLVALHEFGHILGTPEPDEATEGRAWLWAARAAAYARL